MPAEPVFDHQRGDELLPLKSVCAPLFECMSELTDLMLQKGRAAAIKELPRLLSLRSRLASLRSTPSEERLVWLFGIAHTLDEARSKMTLLKDSLGDSFYALAMEGLSQNELYLEGSSLGAMMYGSVAPEIGEKDVMLLASRAMSLPRSDVSLPRLPTPNPSWPFLEGYETADHLHDHLKTDIGTPCEIDIEKILRGLGVHIKSVALDDEQIMGVAVLRPGFAPSILINERHEKNKTAQGCRFTLAHELCHLLLDAEHGRPLAVASGPWAPSSLEKRANAFSAMFLMPKPMLETLAAEYSEMKLADVVAERLKTGRLSAELHLRNLGFLP